MKRQITIFLATLLLTLTVFANVPAPIQAGEAAFEPLFSNNSANSESVVIDMSGLAADGVVTITTTVMFKESQSRPGEYDQKPPYPALLPFGLVLRDSTEVLVDGQPVDVSAWEKTDGLGDWTKPEATFWKDGNRLAYAFRPRQGAKGSVAYSSKGGADVHTLVIREKLEPSRNVSGDLTKYWQFAYIFGRKSLLLKAPPTDVEVKVPEGWDVVTTPAIGAGDGILKGIVDRSENPAAVLVTTSLRAPASYWRVQMFGNVMLIISLFGIPLVGIVLCWLKYSKSSRWWLWGIGFNLLWPAMTALFAYVSQFAADLTMPGAQLAKYGYGELGSMILIVALTAATAVLAFPLWYAVKRFATPKMQPEPES